MSLRYQRDSRRATNGPVVFFSIIKDDTFAEEIRNAFLSGLSFYAYRFPDDMMFSYGSSEGCVEGIGTAGFVIASFDPRKPFLTIPFNDTIRKVDIPSLYEMPLQSTSRDKYCREVEEIVEILKNKPDSKVVAARVEVIDESIDIAEKFYELSQRFPKAFVFCFSTPATGCWMGASPELLLNCSEGILHTMALAGTRPADTSPAGAHDIWDEKNRKEQAIVCDYISDIFLNSGLNPIIENTFNKRAGNVEHICTPISARLTSSLNLEALLKALSPTPALCGQPKDFALNEIKRLENFDRGCYGGFCGPFHSDQDFYFHVVIRCAAITLKRYAAYIGAGITSNSSPDLEWEETILKKTFS